MFDINQVEKDAKAEIAKEQAEKAKTALVKKLRERDTAQRIVANIDREIEDLKQSIADGSFTS